MSGRDFARSRLWVPSSQRAHFKTWWTLGVMRLEVVDVATRDLVTFVR